MQMNELQLEVRLTSALSRTDELFNIWLDGKEDDELVGIARTACYDPISLFIEQVIGDVAQPVVMQKEVFSRGLVVPLCSQLREVVIVSDLLEVEEEITKADLVRGLAELRGEPGL